MPGTHPLPGLFPGATGEEHLLTSAKTVLGSTESCQALDKHHLHGYGPCSTSLANWEVTAKLLPAVPTPAWQSRVCTAEDCISKAGHGKRFHGHADLLPVPLSQKAGLQSHCAAVRSVPAVHRQEQTQQPLLCRPRKGTAGRCWLSEQHLSLLLTTDQPMCCRLSSGPRQRKMKH